MRARDLFERGGPAPTAPPPTKQPPSRPAPPIRQPVRRPDPARPGKIHPDERPNIKPKMCGMRRESRAQAVVDYLLEVKMYSNPMKAYTFADGGDKRCSKCNRPLHNGKCTGCASRGASQSMRTPPPTI